MPSTPKRATTRAASQNTGAMKELRKAVEALTDLGGLLKTAIFGRWDEDKNEQVPGVVDTIKRINDRLDAKDKRDKWLFGGMLLLLSLGAASSLGAPTKQILPVAQQFWQYLVSHPTATP